MRPERSIRAARPGRPAGIRLDLAIAIGLTAATLAVYAGVRGHAFVNLDDPEYVTANPHVRAGLTWAGVGWAFTHVHSATWHPLTSLSHMLDIQLFGLRPGAHLMENVALHVLNSVLLFVVLRRMTQRRWPSAVVAALFALHPQHVESVAWISERKDVLSTLFWMLTLLVYAAYASAPRAGRYLLVVLLFCFGLLAKPMLVTLPFVLLLLDYWPLRRFGAGAWPLAIEKLPLFLLAGAAAAVTYAAQQQAGAVLSTAAVPLSDRFANAPIAYATYLWKTVIPIHLAAFYPLPLPVSAGAAVAATAALALVSAGVLVTMRRRPYLFVGWCWYLGTLVPVLGLVKQGEQAMADRYTYVPLIGVFIMIVWGLADLAAERRWPSWAPVGAAAAALALCAVATATQVAVWRDSATLFDHALRVTSGNYAAHANYGAALMDEGRFAEALSHFEAALRLRPNFIKAQVDAGLAHASLGQADLARADYERALMLDADNALAHYDLGVLLAQQGRPADAAAHYRAAVSADPEHSKAYNNLGLALAALGDSAQAIAAYDAALRVDPAFAPAHLNLAIALEAAGRSDDALTHYETAARLAPDEPLAHLNLGAALAARGRIDDAIEQYRTALRLRPDLTDAQSALADALQQRRAGSTAR
jgi:tetratricopeptide (TPR) repeat protein